MHRQSEPGARRGTSANASRTKSRAVTPVVASWHRCRRAQEGARVRQRRNRAGVEEREEPPPPDRRAPKGTVRPEEVPFSIMPSNEEQQNRRRQR